MEARDIRALRSHPILLWHGSRVTEKSGGPSRHKGFGEAPDSSASFPGVVFGQTFLHAYQPSVLSIEIRSKLFERIEGTLVTSGQRGVILSFSVIIIFVSFKWEVSLQ